MKLTQLFSGEVHAEGRTQVTPAQAESMSRHMRSLAPGQTFSGEIVARNGSEVQIKLSDDMILNARVDRNINIEVGKNMTFEVKSNGSALTLSPLFTNVSTDTNVLKALNMAGLPVNQTSVDMTEQLMAAALPVNKNILQQIYREINNFPQGTVSDVINLHKLQMPVNEANMNQMASYRNLTHHLIEGMDAILESLPEALDSMAREGDVQGALGLYQKILLLGQEVPGDSFSGSPLQEGAALENPEPGEGLPKGQEGAVSEGVLPEGKDMAQSIKNLFMGPEDMVQGPENTVQDGRSTAQAVKNLLMGGEEMPQSGESAVQIEPDAAQGEGESAGPRQVFSDSALREPIQGAPQGEISQALREALSREVLEFLENSGLSPRENAALRAQAAQFAQGQGSVQQLFSALSMTLDGGQLSARTSHAWGKLLSGRAFQELLAGSLKDKWTLRPEELASPGKVEELYRHLDRQLRALAGALEDAGQNNSAAFRAATSLSQNVDFLQQVNQMYAYIQLPLKLQHREAHGELYVYANRKRLSSREGATSALLHLDMENLGPVDVYVTMQNSRVSTKFYLRDEEMIDFIGAHMDLLTSRLNKRGYECSCSISVRESGNEEEAGSGLAPVLNQEKGILLSQYAFDVRT